MDQQASPQQKPPATLLSYEHSQCPVFFHAPACFEVHNNEKRTSQASSPCTVFQQSNQNPISLEFTPLSAGLGEHLFNEIARSIIGSDIAIFETSDLNPNVMIEMGVALTCGARVLPIRLRGTKKHPSDISGQTWAEYEDSATHFIDSGFEQQLVSLISRVIRYKRKNYLSDSAG